MFSHPSEFTGTSLMCFGSFLYLQMSRLWPLLYAKYSTYKKDVVNNTKSHCSHPDQVEKTVLRSH